MAHSLLIDLLYRTKTNVRSKCLRSFQPQASKPFIRLSWDAGYVTELNLDYSLRK
jgi:hypothetical protein